MKSIRKGKLLSRSISCVIKVSAYVAKDHAIGDYIVFYNLLVAALNKMTLFSCWCWYFVL